MLPNLLVGDHLFVTKYSYGYSRYSFPGGIIPLRGRIFEKQPQRGDVVVFKFPKDMSVDYIKRVTGMPGDIVQMRMGRLFVNGQVFEREQIDDFVDRSPGRNRRMMQFIETNLEGRQYRILEISDAEPNDNTSEFVVPYGHFFFMGDNRDDSTDSRVGGWTVPSENLVGRASFIFFSHDGSARIWEFWNWPKAIRWHRLLRPVK